MKKEETTKQNGGETPGGIQGKEHYAGKAGRIIREARKGAMLTQTELGERIGTNKTYISKIENGSLEPGAGAFLRLLEALGLTVEIVSRKN